LNIFKIFIYSYKGQKINAILDKLNSNLKAESKQPICNNESVESMAKDLLFGNTNPTNVNNYKNFVRILEISYSIKRHF